jgi:hypothetical protein
MENETKNNIKIVFLLIIVFVILYALHVTIGKSFENHYDNSNFDNEIHLIFSVSSMDKSLTVTEIYSNGRTLYWPEIIVKNGSANLPNGTIDVGDKITNCQGFLELVWKDTNIHIYSNDFN